MNVDIANRLLPSHICDTYALSFLSTFVDHDDKSYINLCLQEIKDILVLETENICLRELRHAYDECAFMHVAQILCKNDHSVTKLKILPLFNHPDISLHDKVYSLLVGDLSRDLVRVTREEDYQLYMLYHMDSDVSYTVKCLSMFYDESSNTLNRYKLNLFVDMAEFLYKEYGREDSTRSCQYFTAFLTFDQVAKSTKFDIDWDFMIAFFKYGQFNQSYGGNKWVKFAIHSKNLSASKLNDIWYYLDRTFNFMHHTGKFLTKFYYNKELKVALDLHAEAEKVIHVAKYGSPMAFSFFRKCKVRYPWLFQSEYV